MLSRRRSASACACRSATTSRAICVAMRAAELRLRRPSSGRSSPAAAATTPGIGAVDARGACARPRRDAREQEQADERRRAGQRDGARDAPAWRAARTSASQRARASAPGANSSSARTRAGDRERREERHLGRELGALRRDQERREQARCRRRRARRPKRPLGIVFGSVIMKKRKTRSSGEVTSTHQK